MALDRDELNRRRRAREAQRRKQQARQRLILRLVAAAVVLLGCGAAIVLMSRDTAPSLSVPTDPTAPAATEAPAQDPTATEPPSWEKEDTVIRIVAGGDLNVTDNTVWSGQQEGSYDYTGAFLDVASVLSGADLTLLNFEGTVSGYPYGSEKNSAPTEMLTALKNAGVDILQAANSCSVNNGVSGLAESLANIRAAGLEPVGAFSDSEEFQRTKGYTIVNVGDIRIALVAFTKGMSGRGLPVGSEDCVNLLYTDYASTYEQIDEAGIRKLLQAVEVESPDLTIAMLHWGSENNETISNSQKTIARLMTENGVDVILGSHSHLLHQITYDEVSGQLIAYSLGDFFSDASRSGTQYSILLDLEITKDHNAGVTRVTNFSYTPIYTLSNADSAGGHRVVRLENAIAAYEQNYIDKVTESCYNDMLYALKRIPERIEGK